MTTTEEARPPPRLGRSALAVLAGLAANVVLAMLADQLMYANKRGKRERADRS